MVYIIDSTGEKFTFADGMVEKISSDIASDIDTNIMPGAGPMSNQGYDTNGGEKNISVNGVLFDTSSSVTSLGSNTIKSKKVMKLWLEALQNGSQIPLTFYSNYEEYSVEAIGSTTVTDSVSSTSVTINASLVATKVFVKKLTFDEEAGNPEQIPFNMELWVGGY